MRLSMHRKTLRQVIVARMLAVLGVSKNTCGRNVLWSLQFVVSASGWFAAVVLLTLMLAMNLWAIKKSPFFSPVSLVEESAGTYTSARNYITYGFLNSGFLQDFSNSSSPADHPYVYDHYPPGPDILVALILRTGRGYRAVRIAYAAIFLAGIAVYLKFVQLVLSKFELTGAGYAVVLLGPFMLMQNLDRPVTSPIPLLIFAPLVALDAYYRTKKCRSLYLSMSVAFIASMYLADTLVAVLSCWLLLYLTQLIRLDRKHLLAFYASVASGITLHFLQNLFFLGPSIFLKELRMVLGNRILGFPSQETLNQFYRAVGLVHHGAHAPDLGAIIEQIWLNVTLPFPGRGIIALTVALSLLWTLSRQVHYNRTEQTFVLARGEGTGLLANFGKLSIWIAVTVTAGIILFPAFAQEVNLYGARTNLYFLAIGVVAALVYTLQQTIRLRPSLRPPVEASLRFRRLIEGIIWAALTTGLVMSIGKVAYANLAELHQVVASFREYRYTDLEQLRGFAGHLYMTNINTPTVGFFTKEAGFGACDLRSLPDSGGIDTSTCKVADVKRYSALLAQRPRYFFLFHTSDLFPGFADCLPTGTLLGVERGGNACIDFMRLRLSSQFPRVYENRLFEVYDLLPIRRGEDLQRPSEMPYGRRRAKRFISDALTSLELNHNRIQEDLARFEWPMNASGGSDDSNDGVAGRKRQSAWAVASTSGDTVDCRTVMARIPGSGSESSHTIWTEWR